MSPRQRRAAMACYDPLVYAGMVSTHRRRAANDNRAAAPAARDQPLRTLRRFAVLAVAGSVALGGIAHVALRLFVG